MPPPRRSRMGVVPGLRYSEQGLSRGNRPRSSSRTDTPARASSSAVVAPAGPAPPTTTSHRCVTRSPRLGARDVRTDEGRRRADECRDEVHPVVVQPSPSVGEPDRLVTYRIPALEARVASGTLVLTLQRGAEQRVGEHAGEAGAHHERNPGGYARGRQGVGEPRDRNRTGRGAEGPQGGDTPRGAARHSPPGCDEARGEGREGSEFRRPGIRRGR